jgi:acyl carrier protein
MKNNHPEVTEIEAWIISYLAKTLDLDRNEIDTTITFDNYGLDSATAAFMTSDLEDWLQFEIDPALPYEYPTIKELSQHLALKVKNLSE